MYLFVLSQQVLVLMLPTAFPVKQNNTWIIQDEPEVMRHNIANQLNKYAKENINGFIIPENLLHLNIIRFLLQSS